MDKKYYEAQGFEEVPDRDTDPRWLNVTTTFWVYTIILIAGFFMWKFVGWLASVVFVFFVTGTMMVATTRFIRRGHGKGN